MVRRLSVLFAPSGPVPTTAPRRPRPPYLRQEEFRTASDSDPRQCRRGDYHDGGAPSCRGPCRRGGSVTMNMRIATACATLKGTETRDHPLSQRVRRIGPLAPGGSVRVLRARVPVAALAVPAGRSLLRWHRELVRRKWTFDRKSVGGRPLIPDEVRALIVRMGRDNPRWGCLRIRGELAKLGIRVSATRIRTPCGPAASARLLAVAAPPGASSCEPRPRGYWRSTSSLQCDDGVARRAGSLLHCPVARPWLVNEAPLAGHPGPAGVTS